MMSPPKRIGVLFVRYASDAYKLSSLFVRDVLLQHNRRAGRSAQSALFPSTATLEEIRAGTRQLLLDRARPPPPGNAAANLVAIRFLEWDREWNSLRYHGPAGHFRRRWQNWRESAGGVAASSGGGAGGLTTTAATTTKSEGGDNDLKSGATMTMTARVAFMITSGQRRRLSSELGYEASDIRTLKPIEALLLLEHGVAKDDDFRSRLKVLVKENEILTQGGGKTTKTDHAIGASSDASAGDSESEGGDNSLESGTTMTMTARVAFMITSGQRRRLSSELGYEASDIRTLKPIEALLLLEHGVAKDDDFRSRLNVLVKENELLTQGGGETTKMNHAIGASSDASAGDSENIHDKPDVTEDLLLAQRRDGPAINTSGRGDGGDQTPTVISVDADLALTDAAIAPAAAAGGEDNGGEPARTKSFGATDDERSRGVTPEVSLNLAMKPDVAAAFMLSTVDPSACSGDAAAPSSDGNDCKSGLCWFEVVETLRPRAPLSPPGSELRGRREEGKDEERVLALFRTEEEAKECVRLKESIRSREGTRTRTTALVSGRGANVGIIDQDGGLDKDGGGGRTFQIRERLMR